MKKPDTKGNPTNNIIRVEDGFLRSVKLGSDLSQPYSLIFDDKGIYFNGEKPSRLEELLNNDIYFNDVVRDIGSKIIKELTSKGLSKYNILSNKKINLDKENKEQKVILIIGQVDDDASIKYSKSKVKNKTTPVKPIKVKNQIDLNPPVIENGNWIIQLCVFSKQKSAERFSRELIKKHSIRILIDPVKGQERTLYRVSSQKFETKETAKIFLSALDQKGINGFIKKLD